MIQAQLVSQSHRQIQEIVLSTGVSEARVDGLLVEKQETIQSLIERLPVSTGTTPVSQPPRPLTLPGSPSELAQIRRGQKRSPEADALPSRTANPMGKWTGHKVVTASSVAKEMCKEHPQVIISYQSMNEQFMKKLRKYLNDNGVETVDGQLSSLRCRVLNQPNA